MHCLLIFHFLPLIRGKLGKASLGYKLNNDYQHSWVITMSILNSSVIYRESLSVYFWGRLNYLKQYCLPHEWLPGTLDDLGRLKTKTKNKLSSDFEEEENSQGPAQSRSSKRNPRLLRGSQSGSSWKTVLSLRWAVILELNTGIPLKLAPSIPKKPGNHWELLTQVWKLILMVMTTLLYASHYS